MRIFRKCTKRRYFTLWLLIVVFAVFYLEFYTYFSNTYRWLQPQCENPSDCTRVLFVADPQIIGKYNEILHGITPFSILDSDLYLKKTYNHAFNFAKPDVVVFLGDLMDEGSTASESEFRDYVRRIFQIFSTRTKHIWLPGDNDIGGEGMEVVTKEKLNRFQRAFAQPDLIPFRNLTFFKINRLTQTIPVFKKNRDFYDVSRLFIGLSHIPMMFIPSLFVDKVFAKMQPHVLFTAHEHKSMILSTDRHIVPVNPDNNNIFEYTLGATDIYEFIIPSCSYRMGTEKIGFGFAVFEKNELRYTVLWSPSRFRQLICYLLLIICFVLISLCILCSYSTRIPFRRII